VGASSAGSCQGAQQARVLTVSVEEARGRAGGGEHALAVNWQALRVGWPLPGSGCKMPPA